MKPSADIDREPHQGRTTATLSALSLRTSAYLLVGFLVFVFLLGAGGAAVMNTKVAPGKWKVIKLKNLPEGANVAVRVQSTGSLIVALVNSRAYEKSSRRLFAGQLEKTLSFSVVIPETADYFLVLDNRGGTENREVNVAIQVVKSQKSSTDKEL